MNLILTKNLYNTFIICHQLMWWFRVRLIELDPQQRPQCGEGAKKLAILKKIACSFSYKME